MMTNYNYSYNNIENKINRYNELEYITSKVKFSDYVSNKNDIVHNKLYSSALNKYLNDVSNKLNITVDEYKKTHIFIEIKNTEYWKPSTVYIKETIYPFKIEKINLTKYWDNYQYVDNHKDFDITFFDSDIDINGLEVIKIDYVNGKIKFRNKYSGEELYRDFNFLNEDTIYNEKCNSLKDTFSYKIQNKIYGE